MDETRVILSLEFRLGLTNADYVTLRKIADYYYNNSDPEVGTCTVAHLLTQFGVLGCRRFVELTSRHVGLVEMFDTPLDLLLYDEEN